MSVSSSMPVLPPALNYLTANTEIQLSSQKPTEHKETIGDEEIPYMEYGHIGLTPKHSLKYDGDKNNCFKPIKHTVTYQFNMELVLKHIQGIFFIFGKIKGITVLEIDDPKKDLQKWKHLQTAKAFKICIFSHLNAFIADCVTRNMQVLNSFGIKKRIIKQYFPDGLSFGIKNFCLKTVEKTKITDPTFTIHVVKLNDKNFLNWSTSVFDITKFNNSKIPTDVVLLLTIFTLTMDKLRVQLNMASKVFSKSPVKKT